MTSFNRNSARSSMHPLKESVIDAELDTKLSLYSNSFENDENAFATSTLQKLREVTHRSKRQSFHPFFPSLALISAALVLAVYLQPISDESISRTATSEVVSTLSAPSASLRLQTMPLHTDTTAEFLRTGTL